MSDQEVKLEGGDGGGCGGEGSGYCDNYIRGYVGCVTAVTVAGFLTTERSYQAVSKGVQMGCTAKDSTGLLT